MSRWSRWVPKWMKSKPQNEYKPWEAEGITEAEYWKAQYLERVLRLEKVLEVTREQRAEITAWKGTCEKAQIEAEVLRKEQGNVIGILNPSLLASGLVDAYKQVKQVAMSCVPLTQEMMEEIIRLRDMRRILIGRGAVTVGRTRLVGSNGPNNIVVVWDAKGKGYDAGEAVRPHMGPMSTDDSSVIAWFVVEGQAGVQILTNALQAAAKEYQDFLESTQQVTLASEKTITLITRAEDLVPYSLATREQTLRFFWRQPQ